MLLPFSCPSSSALLLLLLLVLPGSNSCLGPCTSKCELLLISAPALHVPHSYFDPIADSARLCPDPALLAPSLLLLLYCPVWPSSAPYNYFWHRKSCIYGKWDSKNRSERKMHIVDKCHWKYYWGWWLILSMNETINQIYLLFYDQILFFFASLGFNVVIVIIVVVACANFFSTRIWVSSFCGSLLTWAIVWFGVRWDAGRLGNTRRQLQEAL